LSGPVCDSRPIRQDLLDPVVWTAVVRLLEDPTLGTWMPPFQFSVVV
jgi:site-specific DNA recombinase